MSPKFYLLGTDGTVSDSNLFTYRSTRTEFRNVGGVYSTLGLFVFPTDLNVRNQGEMCGETHLLSTGSTREQKDGFSVTESTSILDKLKNNQLLYGVVRYLCGTGASTGNRDVRSN